MPLYPDGTTEEADKVRLLGSIFMATMGVCRRHTGNRSHMVPTYVRELVNPDAPSTGSLRLYNGDEEIEDGSPDRPICGFGLPFTRLGLSSVDKCRVCVMDVLLARS